MGAKDIRVHPAFYRRIRHYRDRIAVIDGRPQAAAKFVKTANDLIFQLLENPLRGHLAGFEAHDLSDIRRASLPGYSVFALFYRWTGHVLTIITLEHTAQDLPSRLADIVSTTTSKPSRV